MDNIENGLDFSIAGQKRLAIIIPYRDRRTHLSEFLRRVPLYFERDKVDQHIPVEYYIIEQGNEHPFNIGLLKNIGYVLARENCDYVCFHDVDYIPIWADYSYPVMPSRLVYFGSEKKRISNTSNGYITHNSKSFFGGVTMLRNEHFEKVNGYPVDYWGWGFEDGDLQMRCHLEGLIPRMLEGTYEQLFHNSNGYEDDGKFNDVALANQKRFDKKVAAYKKNISYKQTGLNTTQFSIKNKTTIGVDGKLVDNARLFLVDFNGPA